MSNERQSGFKKNNDKNSIVMMLCTFVLLIVFLSCSSFVLNKKKSNSLEIETENKNSYLSYRISGNSLENFDLYFLKLENMKSNMVYSPLSIKYALEMLEEGASGQSREQIANIIGTYRAKKYVNSENMSFANAMFVNNLFKDSVKMECVNNLTNKFDASVIYDSFETPSVLNSWVSDKTFKLINNLSDDISSNDFLLVNALAINMDWVNRLRSTDDLYTVNYKHQNFSSHLGPFDGYSSLDFNNSLSKVNAVPIKAVANKYDILKKLGEDSIRDIVGKKYNEWLANGAADSCYGADLEPSVGEYLDNYIKEIKENYGNVSSSSDFYFYTDDDVKVFAKDLKSYNGTTLQYVGIMPKNVSLSDYVKNMDAKSVNKLISSLKDINVNSFEEGVITEISGLIPVFKFDYQLNLMDDLKKLGINDIFDANKADLSNLVTTSSVINNVAHKSTIEFSNDGIKAAAVTEEGGAGAFDCGFDYLFDVPVYKIDLNFDNPYLFLIRDKDTGEVWFTGTVYEPTIYSKQ